MRPLETGRPRWGRGDLAWKRGDLAPLNEDLPILTDGGGDAPAPKERGGGCATSEEGPARKRKSDNVGNRRYRRGMEG